MKVSREEKESKAKENQWKLKWMSNEVKDKCKQKYRNYIILSTMMRRKNRIISNLMNMAVGPSTQVVPPISIRISCETCPPPQI